MKKKKKKKFSFQKRNKKKVLKNETIYSYALACFTKLAYDCSMLRNRTFKFGGSLSLWSYGSFATGGIHYKKLKIYFEKFDFKSTIPCLCHFLLKLSSKYRISK